MIFTNFNLPDTTEKSVKVIAYSSTGLKLTIDLLKNRRHMTALLIANPSTKMLIQLGILRRVGIIRSPVFLFDLILKNPKSYMEQLIANVKGIFIRMLDFIFVIHKDTSGYENAYKLRSTQFIYLPFKANNYDSKEKITTCCGDYAVALGASQRDYGTLIEAAKLVDEKIVIVCSDDNAAKHNANVGDDNLYPPNITRIKENVDSASWYSYLANCKFVIIPILSSAIQPAGISVYLEAMILKKAVVISEGASTNFILENGVHALLAPAGDPKKLADAISLMSRDEKLRKKIEVSGYNYALSLGNDLTLRKNILNLILSKIAG